VNSIAVDNVADNATVDELTQGAEVE